MWTDSSILHDQLVKLVHSSLSLWHSYAVHCSGLCFLWRFRFLLEGKVLLQLWHGRFSWSLFLLEKQTVLHVSLWFFSQAPSTHILLEHVSFWCGPLGYAFDMIIYKANFMGKVNCTVARIRQLEPLSNMTLQLLTGPSFNSKAPQNWEPLRKTGTPLVRTGASELEGSCIIVPKKCHI